MSLSAPVAPARATDSGRASEQATPSADAHAQNSMPAPLPEDMLVRARLVELRKDLDSVAKDVAAHVVEAPFEVLCDCYCADYALATLKARAACYASPLSTVALLSALVQWWFRTRDVGVCVQHAS
jgi:hypothetical protein